MGKKIRKPHKKQSAGNRKYQSARAMIDNVAVAQVNNDPLCFIDLNNYTVKDPTLETCHKLFEVPHRWNIFLAVSCLENNGKIKLVPDEFRLPFKVHQNDLSEALHERHVELIEKCNETMEVRFIGWFASANGKQFNLENVDSIFELMMENKK